MKWLSPAAGLTTVEIGRVGDGTPQCGQLTASLETSRPHSRQGDKAISLLPPWNDQETAPVMQHEPVIAKTYLYLRATREHEAAAVEATEVRMIRLAVVPRDLNVVRHPHADRGVARPECPVRIDSLGGHRQDGPECDGRRRCCESRPQQATPAKTPQSIPITDRNPPRGFCPFDSCELYGARTPGSRRQFTRRRVV